MDKQFSISEAKNKLPAIVHDIEHGPAVQLTRHGKPVAVLISISQYKRLVSRPKNFWATLSAFRESADTSTLLSSGDNFFDHRDQSPGMTSGKTLKTHFLTPSKSFFFIDRQHHSWYL